MVCLIPNNISNFAAQIIGIFINQKTWKMKKIALILIVFACIGLNAMGQTAYIPNEEDNTVSVINLVTNTVVATIPVGISPYSVCAIPNGTKVYIPNYGGNSVSVINTSTNTVLDSIMVGLHPNGIACSPDGRKVYITCNLTNSLYVINTSNDSIIATIHMYEYGAYGVTVNPNGNKVYVVNSSSNLVYVIDTVTNNVTDSIAVGPQPAFATITPDGSKLYVTDNWANNIFVINTATNLIIDTINIGNTTNFLCISPDGTTIYVSAGSIGTDYLGIINVATNTITALLPTTEQWNIGGIQVSLDGTKVYFTDGNYRVFVMDVSTNLFIDSIEVGIGPYAFGNFISPYVTPLVCSSYFVIYADTINQNHYFITDSITGFAPYHYLWSWGDGNYDSIPNPSHTYSDTGNYTICLTITDTFGCQSTFCDSLFDISRLSDLIAYVDVLGSTGINKISQSNNSLSLYPNPTANLLTLSLPDKNIKSCTINLYDMLGEKVLGELRMENGELKIDVSTLSQGIYFLEVTMDGEKVVRKVVKI